MAFNQEVITWTKNTASVDDHTQVISLVGSFTPKVIVVMTQYYTTLGDSSLECVMSIGVSDITNNNCIAVRQINGLTTSDTHRSIRNDSCATLMNSAGAPQDQIEISAMASGSFTVKYIDNDSGLRTYTAYVFGGTDLEYEIKPWTSDTTSGAHTQNVSTTLKSADFGIFLGIPNTSLNIDGGSTNFYVGMADATVEGSVWGASRDNIGDTDTFSYHSGSKAVMYRSSNDGSAIGGASVEMDAIQGLKVTWDADKGTTAYHHIALLLKGIDVDVGTDVTADSGDGTGELDHTTGITPEGLLMITNMENGVDTLDEQKIGIGMADGSEEAFVGNIDKHNVPISETRRIHVDDHVMIAALADNPNPATQSEGTMGATPFGTNKFTIDYTKVDATARTFLWAVFAETGGAVTKTFTIDAILQKEFTDTFTIDTILQKEFTKTFTIDTILQKQVDKTFTIDTILQKEFTDTFTIDTVLQKQVDKTFTIDAHLTATGVITKSFTIDAILQDTELLDTFTIDTILQKASLTKIFTIDTILQKVFIDTFTIDAVLQKQVDKTFTIDAHLTAIGVLTKSFTIDTILQKVSLTKTFTIDTVLQKVSLTKTFTMDAHLTISSPTKTFTIDAVLSGGVSTTVRLGLGDFIALQSLDLDSFITLKSIDLGNFKI